MTYFKTTLISAVASLALASPAFADNHGDNDKKNHDAMHSEMKKADMKSNSMKSDSMKSDSMKMDKTDKMWNEETKMWETRTTKMENMEVRGALSTSGHTGNVLQSNETNVPRTMNDDKLLMSEGDARDENYITRQEMNSTAADNAIAVPTTNGQYTTTVSCPAGTTAQADMTCLVTGNYNPRR